MIQLTDATKINKNGEEVDASLWLIHVDSRNLGIVEGRPTLDAQGRKKQSVIAYFGSVETALIRSIDIAIKHGSEARSLSDVVDRIDNLTKHIEDVCNERNYPNMMQLLRGEIHE